MVDRMDLDVLKGDRTRLLAELKGAGAKLVGNRVACPFHDDRHPSAGVHEVDGTWMFTCHGCPWNGEKQSGDIIDVVRRVHRCSFPEACRYLGLSNGKVDSAEREGQTNATRTAPETEDGVRRARNLAEESHAALMSDESALDHLWRTRGIDKATAARFGLGITGAPGKRFWTFPVTHNAIKAHAADGQPPKSWWEPRGTSRNRLWPVDAEPNGPVWLCPGELKGLAVAGVGRATAGITSGEGSEKKPADLPTGTFDLLRGRAVAIVPDDDPTGVAWGEHVRGQLVDAGIEARIVDLQLDRDAGLKDIGDWITQRLFEDAKEPEAVAATLDHAWKRSDPWHGTSIGELWTGGAIWRPVTSVRTGFNALDEALGGGFRTLGVHMAAGKTGEAKTQLAIGIALRAAQHGTPVGIISLELGADEVGQLIAAQLADIPK